MTAFGKAWDVVKNMNNYQMLEYIHFAIQEAMNGNIDELGQAIAFVEDLREAYLTNEDGSPTSGTQNTNQ